MSEEKISQEVKKKKNDLLSDREVYRRTLVLAGIAVAIIVVIWIMITARSIVQMAFVAYLIMLAMRGPINGLRRLTKKKLGLGLASGICYFVVFGLLITVGGMIVPVLFKELSSFAETFNLVQVTDFIKRINSEALDLGALVEQAYELDPNTIKTIISAVTTASSGVFFFFTTFVLSLHMSLYQEKLAGTVLGMTKRKEVAEIVGDFSTLLSKQLGGWIRGEFMLMLVIGLTSYIGFSLIGVPYALPLALLAGLLELLPNIGPIVAAVPAVALALMIGWPTALVTLVFCVILQQLENVFIVPRIMKQAANINPIISILLVLGGLEIMGVTGALLALPIYLTIRTSYIYFVRDKKFVEILAHRKVAEEMK